MKKILILLPIAFTVTFVSCEKQNFCFYSKKACKCKTYAGGVVVKEYEQEIDGEMKCSDYTTIVTDEDGGLKTGVECK